MLGRCHPNECSGERRLQRSPSTHPWRKEIQEILDLRELQSQDLFFSGSGTRSEQFSPADEIGASSQVASPQLPAASSTSTTPLAGPSDLPMGTRRDTGREEGSASPDPSHPMPFEGGARYAEASFYDDESDHSQSNRRRVHPSSSSPPIMQASRDPSDRDRTERQRYERMLPPRHGTHDQRARSPPYQRSGDVPPHSTQAIPPRDNREAYYSGHAGGGGMHHLSGSTAEVAQRTLASLSELPQDTPMSMERFMQFLVAREQARSDQFDRILQALLEMRRDQSNYERQRRETAQEFVNALRSLLPDSSRHH